MKKTRMIAFALVAAVMLMGAGYAYWSDTLTINNTVSTGEFDVDFTSYTFLDPLPLVVTGDNAGENYMNSKITAQWSYGKVLRGATDRLNVEIGNMYPNSLALYVARIENNGTIPAVVRDVDVDFTTEPANLDFKDHLVVAGGYMLFDKNNNYKRGDMFLTNLDNLAATLTNKLGGVRMEPGDYMLMDIPPEYQSQIKEAVEPYNPGQQNCIIFYMPSTVVNEDNIEDQNTVFNINFNFKQHNEP